MSLDPKKRAKILYLLRRGGSIQEISKKTGSAWATVKKVSDDTGLSKPQEVGFAKPAKKPQALLAEPIDLPVVSKGSVVIAILPEEAGLRMIRGLIE